MGDPSTQPDWKLLNPHRPLPPGSNVYVARPEMGGAELARWILGGGSTILVGGPVGVGKSTECAHAAFELRSHRVACFVPVDRLTNIRRLTADELLQIIGGRLFWQAVNQLNFPPDHPLAANFTAHDTPTGRDGFRASSPQVTHMLLGEVARWTGTGRVALVIDGLEKLPEGATALEIFDALGSLPSDVDLIVVIPWHAVYGRTGDVVIRPGEKLFAMRPIGPEGEDPGRFFGRMLGSRVIAKMPSPVLPLLHRAFEASGGIPRTFLQIIADAATYARVKRGDAWPDDSDLEDALNEQRDSLRRLLSPGDTEAIGKAQGTDGRELSLERRVRLLAHGILLERSGERGPRLVAHPLVPLAA